MHGFRRIALICFALVLAMCGVLCGALPAMAQPARAQDQANQNKANQVNFGKTDNVLDIKSFLAPYRAPGGGVEPDGSSWYIIQVRNDTVRPATRVLLAGQPPRAALSLLPRRSRPAILAVASSDSGTVVETASAYGRRAWRVIVPPVSTVGLAVRVGSADTPPALQAWTEPALSSHNRQLAIFITAVGTLIAAAALITGGLAVLIGHAAPRWVALTLLLLLFSWLSGTGMFDASIATRIGGPYGLSAGLTALALAAGARLANAIIPVREIWPKREKLFHRAIYGLIILGGLAYLGVPGATLLTDIAIVAGSLAVAVYLVYCGRHGHKAAQVIAPSAAAFALVALAAAVMAIGGLGENLTGPAATGGFAAAGAILLALSVIASEEIAVLPFLHGSYAARLLQDQAPDAPQALHDPNAPFNSLARAAIGAAHQGVFDLDFRAGLLTLSVEAAQMVGLSVHETPLPHENWVGLVHPDDREVYTQAMEDYRHRPGLAFRLEFRARAGNAPYRWLELRASIVSEQDVPSDCLGLISDITQRKEAEYAAMMAQTERLREAAVPRDPLTGLGNRVALMETLDGLGANFAVTVFALLDVDRFKAIHASLGDKGADTILKMLAERLGGLSETAQLFRVGGDSFAFLFSDPKRGPQAIGNALVDVCSRPYRIESREVFAPCSVGLVIGSQSEDPFALIKNAELALLSAKRQGGGCARLYSAELETMAPGDSVALESALRGALAGDQLDVFYQPIVRLTDRSVAGFEALLRWRHPVKGLIAPGDFIAHSEETGLIVALGRFALERAATDLAHWQRYFPLKPPLFVSVNVSRRQLKDAGFEPLLKTILSGSGIAPGTLNLEITESAIAADAKVPQIMARIREAGAGLSIDDFGTGASTLSEFRTLPADTVKIDKSFLARHTGADMDNGGEVVLSGIVNMAHELKRAVVAEGVESEADAQFLAKIGCEFGQGYYFSPALDGAAALDYIARHYNITAGPQLG
ncbi:MAG TPA: GGDEF and EAL domain-containing protein [Rhizomicrobium sp.]|nr:GGDEF and EAL domain-containing protein [Rhizomicrobium sp.]